MASSSSALSLLLVALVAGVIMDASAQRPPPPPPPLPLLPPLPPLPPPALKKVLKMQGMFKKKLAKGIEFFPSDGPDASCDRPPRDVMKGIPILEGCREFSENEVACACVKHPEPFVKVLEELDVDTSSISREGYGNLCGRCVDPCALKWKPQMLKPAMKDGDYGSMEDYSMEEMDGDGMMDLTKVPRIVRSLLNVAMEIVEKKMDKE